MHYILTCFSSSQEINFKNSYQFWILDFGLKPLINWLKTPYANLKEIQFFSYILTSLYRLCFLRD